MIRRLFLRFAGLLAAAMILAPAVPLSTATADELTPAQKEEIGPLVHQYLIDHPEVIQEALQALDARQKAEAAQAQANALSRLKEPLFASKYQAVMGNPKAPITLVEFIDYNCTYCKRALGDTKALLDSDPDVRIVIKEFPILSRGSVEAARVASAVNLVAPDKYQAFHFELLSAKGQADEDRALAAAAKTGVDVNAVKKALDDPSVASSIQEAYSLAQNLDINGTPAFVLANEVMPGAIGLEALQSKITAVRSCGKTSC